MSFERYGGISSDLLLNNATDIIRLMGTGRNNNQSGKIFINNTLVAQTVSRGLNMYIFDERLNLISSKAYSLGNDNDINLFVSDVYSIPPRRYYAIISYDDIVRNPTVDGLFSAKNGHLWFEAWSKYGLENPTATGRARIPYAAFGCSELGITHETYGDYKAGSSNPTAELIATTGAYERFGTQGFGKPILRVGAKVITANTETESFTTGGYDNTFLMNVRAKSSNRTASITVTDTPPSGSGLNAVTHTLNVDKNIHDTFQLEIPIQHVDSTFTLSQVAPAGDTLTIEYIEVKRAATDTSTAERVSAIVKRNNGVSVSKVVFSNNGYNISDDTMLNNMALTEQSYFTTNSHEIVCQTNKPALTINGTIESYYIEVNEDRDYCVLGFIKASQDVNVKVTISAFNENHEPLSIQTPSGNGVSVLVNETNVNTSDVVFMENYILAKTAPASVMDNFSVNTYGDVFRGGHEAPYVSKDAARMTTGVKYVRIKVETDGQIRMALPIITQMKFALTKDSTFIGGVNQSTV